MQLTYLTRSERVTCKNKRFTGFRELSSRRNRVDFSVSQPTRDISFDFDCKRKPVRASFRTEHPLIDGVHKVEEKIAFVQSFNASKHVFNKTA